MRYGVKIDEHGRADYSMVRCFTNTRWNAIRKQENPDWEEFLAEQVFISFCEEDRLLMDTLIVTLYDSELLVPVTVESNRNGGIALATLVRDHISECDYFIPLLTKNSISNQWVNQEVGCAIGLQKAIYPIVETDIMENLKGFIHIQLQLPYNFTLRDRKLDEWDRRYFHLTCKDLVNDLHQDVIKRYGIIKA